MPRVSCWLLLLVLAVPGAARAQGGTPVGPEFRVNTYTTGYQDTASVAADPAGNFVVVWDGQRVDDPITGIFGQRFSISGVPLGPEFRVNTTTADFQILPSVAADAAGNFVIVWGSDYQDGIFGQRFDGAGAPLGPEFRINTYTTNQHVSPSVSADAAGNFVVAWTSPAQDGSVDGVFAQRFGPILPVELTQFSVE